MQRFYVVQRAVFGSIDQTEARSDGSGSSTLTSSYPKRMVDIGSYSQCG